MDVASKLITCLRDKCLTIATMESCTGGFLTHLMTNISGSSEVVLGGYVTYTAEQKIRCHVEEYVINTYGVYSRECSKAMADAVHYNCYSDVCIGVTGRIGDGENEVDVTILYPTNDKWTKSVISSHYIIPEHITDRLEKKKYLAEKIFEGVLSHFQYTKTIKKGM